MGNWCFWWMTILSLGRSLSDLLNSKGFSVLEAENGRKALEMLKKLPHFPCLSVLDLAMPIMDGRGFLKRRAQDPILSDIPVVVVSGNKAPTLPLPGTDGYLNKPVK